MHIYVHLIVLSPKNITVGGGGRKTLVEKV